MDLTFSYREPTENLTTLADGTPFPAGINLTVIRTGVEPIIELTLEVEVGRPVLARFALRRRGPAGRPLTATEIHNTKVSEIVDAAIRSVAASALVSADAIHDPAAGDQGAGQRASDLARGEQAYRTSARASSRHRKGEQVQPAQGGRQPALRLRTHGKQMDRARQRPRLRHWRGMTWPASTR